MNDTLQELIDDIASGVPDYYWLLSGIVFTQRPKHVVELGTGTGRSGKAIMQVLPEDSTFTTINWPNPPSGDEVGRELSLWQHDHRLTQILGDTRDPSSAEQVPDWIGLLFIDSTHEFEAISAEWALYGPKLADQALVCVDDLDFPGGGIRRWWDALEFEKVETKLSPFNFGVLRYRRAG